MSDEDSFLAAIAASPADDTPRLVYADWLDDQSDPRAEYVRLEVERHRLTPRDKQWPDLTARLDALRPAADPHRLPRIDRVGRYSVFLGEGYYSLLRQYDRVGSVLDRIDEWLGVVPATSTTAPGDYLYPISYRHHTLHIVGRMRVTELVPRRPGVYPYVAGSEGTVIRLWRPAGPDVLARLGWYDGGPGRAEPTAGGTPLLPPVYLRTVRLTPATAADFDTILRAG